MRRLGVAGQRDISEEAAHLTKQHQEHRPEIVILDSGTDERNSKFCQVDNMRYYTSINGSHIMVFPS